MLSSLAGEASDRAADLTGWVAGYMLAARTTDQPKSQGNIMSYYKAALENYNYYNDPRVEAGLRGKWYKSFDSRNMTVTVEIFHEAQSDDEPDEYEVTFPAHYVVCDLCEGHGRHVNPSIDAGGISGEDMYDDPDFAEHYFGGSYDQTCNECGGNKVVPTINTAALSEDLKKELKKFRECQDEREACFAEMMAERRMGC